MRQVKTLASSKDWEGLEAFAREKKSPIGLEPFIAAAKANGAPEGTLSRWAIFPPGCLPITSFFCEGWSKPLACCTVWPPQCYDGLTRECQLSATHKCLRGNLQVKRCNIGCCIYKGKFLQPLSRNSKESNG